MITQDTAGSTSEEGISSWLASIPLHITIDGGAGYDDNINASASGEGAWFTSENVTLSYDRLAERMQVHLLTSAGLTRFFNSTATQEENANVTLSLMYNSSTRLSFAANVFANYQAEPDFKTNVGPENVRANHFQTIDTFSVTYHWLPRFTTITSYTFQRIKYDEPLIGMFQDRVETTFGEVFQLSRSSRTNLFGEYRFEIINYDTAPTNSTTHFVLAGIDHKLTEQLTLNARGGETFRSFEQGGSTVDPHFEGLLTYAKTDRLSLMWTTSYGVEEFNSATGVSSSVTLRTGLKLTYGLSARIGLTTACYYNHAENTGTNSSGTDSEGSQDSFDLSVSLGYKINQRFALHIDYNRSSVESAPESTSDYSRNRYSAGLRYTY